MQVDQLVISLTGWIGLDSIRSSMHALVVFFAALASDGDQNVHRENSATALKSFRVILLQMLFIWHILKKQFIPNTVSEQC